MEQEKKETFYQNNATIAVLAVVCTFLWGTTYPVVKIAYELINLPNNDVGGKLVFAGLQFFIAGIVGFLFISLKNKKITLPSRGLLPEIIKFGLVQTCIQHIFFYIGLAYTTGVKGSVLYSMGTFIAIVLSHFYYANDKMNMSKAVGCALGVFGVLVISLGGERGSGFTLLGDGFMLIATAFFAIGSLIGKNVAEKADPVLVTSCQLATGGAMLIVIGSIGFGGQASMITGKGMGVILYLSFMSISATTIWNTLLKYNKIGKVAIYYFLLPIFGAILSGIFLHEEILNFKNIMALILVCLGIYIVNAPKKEITYEEQIDS